jgi:hypothetical protein
MVKGRYRKRLPWYNFSLWGISKPEHSCLYIQQIFHTSASLASWWFLAFWKVFQMCNKDWSLTTYVLKTDLYIYVQKVLEHYYWWWSWSCLVEHSNEWRDKLWYYMPVQYSSKEGLGVLWAYHLCFHCGDKIYIKMELMYFTLLGWDGLPQQG